MRDRSCRDRSAGRGPVAHRVHTLTPGVVACASGAEFGRPRVKRRNWSGRERSHFRFCGVRPVPFFAALPSGVAVLPTGRRICTLQRRSGVISGVCCRGERCFPYRCRVSVRISTLGAISVVSRPETRRVRHSAPKEPFCPERAVLHRKSRSAPDEAVLEPTPAGRSHPERGVPHRVFCTVRSARANETLTPRRRLAHGSP